jgi:hypothetical protein
MDVLNLHGIVSSYIAAINPFITGQVQISTGSVTNADGSITPQYSAAIQNVPLQVQAMSGQELRQVEGLNLQSVPRAVYLCGHIQGLNRPFGKGGDLLTFNGATWLVAAVIEPWDAAGWTKIAVVEQMPNQAQTG